MMPTIPSKGNFAFLVTITFLISIALSGDLQAQSVSPETIKLEEQIRILTQPAIDLKEARGIVVGVVRPEGRLIVRFGTFSKDDQRVPDVDTMFEIGSITKVFTACMLADMACRGEVALTDSIAKILNREETFLRFQDRPVTLLDLTTHYSGLPRIPTNMVFKDVLNPYLHYTTQEMLSYCTGYKYKSPPGVRMAYSNLGVGLLGYALSQRMQLEYENAIKCRILQPLYMLDTTITLNEYYRSKMIPPHNEMDEPVPPWDIPAMAGAGALRSNIHDMLRFIEANIHPCGPLENALLLAQKSHRSEPKRDRQVGLGWMIRDAGKIHWHNGGTGGSRSYLAFDKDKQVGVVVLSNTTFGICDEIGVAVLDGLRTGTFATPVPPKVKLLPIDELSRYVGSYTTALFLKMNVELHDGFLSIQLANQPKFRLYGTPDESFICKTVNVRIKFTKAKDGTITGLSLEQDGSKSQWLKNLTPTKTGK